MSVLPFDITRLRFLDQLIEDTELAVSNEPDVLGQKLIRYPGHIKLSCISLRFDVVYEFPVFLWLDCSMTGQKLQILHGLNSIR